MRIIKYLGSLVFLAVLIPTPSVADPDIGASRITLEVSCPITDNNCFTDMGALMDWMWLIRNPSTSSPLLVDIGAGTFNLPSDRMFCDQKGHITLRGSGHDNTVLGGGGFNSGGDEYPVITIRDCANITVQDLTIRSDEWNGNAGSQTGILWINSGNSTWSDVTVESTYYGWYDTVNDCVTPGEHYWFGSKIHTKPVLGFVGEDVIAYDAGCGKNWFFGGELKAIADKRVFRIVAGAVALGDNGELQIFGSLVRTVAVNGAKAIKTLSWGFNGLYARGNGNLHMHGGIVAVRGDLNTADQDVNGAVADQNSMIHTPDTAFTVKAGGNGEARRAKGNIMSPFQWPKSTEPPTVTSETGADTYVETDCATSGCDLVGNETHMLIYNQHCSDAGPTADPWFDVVTGECRGGGNP